MRRMRRTLLLLLVTSFIIFTACGYHTAGKAVRLPQNVRTIYVPVFSNTTHAYRVDQALTAAYPFATGAVCRSGHASTPANPSERLQRPENASGGAFRRVDLECHPG